MEIKSDSEKTKGKKTNSVGDHCVDKSAPWLYYYCIKTYKMKALNCASFFPMHVACCILHVVEANIVLASPHAILVQYLCYSYSTVARDLWSITT